MLSHALSRVAQRCSAVREANKCPRRPFWGGGGGRTRYGQPRAAAPAARCSRPGLRGQARRSLSAFVLRVLRWYLFGTEGSISPSGATRLGGPPARSKRNQTKQSSAHSRRPAAAGWPSARSRSAPRCRAAAAEAPGSCAHPPRACPQRAAHARAHVSRMLRLHAMSAAPAILHARDGVAATRLQRHGFLLQLARRRLQQLC